MTALHATKTTANRTTIIKRFGQGTGGGGINGAVQGANGPAIRARAGKPILSAVLPGNSEPLNLIDGSLIKERTGQKLWFRLLF